MSYYTVLLSSLHVKNEFNCGQELLDAYLHKQAKQDVKKRLAACFVHVNAENRIMGYYTLSSSSIKKELIPEELRNKFQQSYSDLPVTLLGRLARDNKYKGQRLGELLLLDALKRSHDISLSIGSIAVIVDPIDERARKFYLSYGFIELPDSKRMFLAMQTISKLFVEL